MSRRLACSVAVALAVLAEAAAGGGAQTSPPTGAEADRIVYDSLREGSWQIYVMRADGSNVVRLTDAAGWNGVPAFSPDGRKIAFSSDRDGESPQIYVMGADGSNVTRLTSPPGGSTSPSFSPDGSRIVFASNRDAPSDADNGLQIYVMAADGSNAVRLTAPPGRSRQPVFTPDGNRIVFASNRGGTFQIYRMNADGSGATSLTSAPGGITTFALSPDGRKIAFASQQDGKDQISLMEADGSHVARLTSPPGQSRFPAFSRDGTRIAFASDRDGPNQIYVMGVGGSKTTRLTRSSGPDFDPAFGPPGPLPPPSAPLMHPAALCATDPTITPGVGVGRLKLGMPLTEVAGFLAAPPAPAKKGASGGSSYEELYYYPSSDLDIVARDGRIVSITLGAGTEDLAKCATREGVRRGGPTAAVKSAYGNPQGAISPFVGNTDLWVYNRRGLVVWVNTQGQVLSLSVFAPGTFCPLYQQLSALQLYVGLPGRPCGEFTPPLSRMPVH